MQDEYVLDTTTVRAFIGGVRDVLWIVLAMIGIVFVIASANVTNLLLVRGQGRALELDVRAALGAGGWRIARSMLAESALLALLGGVAGLFVRLIFGVLKNQKPFDPNWTTATP